MEIRHESRLHRVLSAVAFTLSVAAMLVCLFALKGAPMTSVTGAGVVASESEPGQDRGAITSAAAGECHDCSCDGADSAPECAPSTSATPTSTGDSVDRRLPALSELSYPLGHRPSTSDAPVFGSILTRLSISRT